MKILTPQKALDQTRALLNQKGFQLLSRSDESFYYRKFPYIKKVRLSLHRRKFKPYEVDLCYDIVYDDNTIINDVVYRVNEALLHIKGKKEK